MSRAQRQEVVPFQCISSSSRGWRLSGVPAYCWSVISPLVIAIAQGFFASLSR